MQHASPKEVSQLESRASDQFIYDPELLPADKAVLDNLFFDIKNGGETTQNDSSTLEKLQEFRKPPVVITGKDYDDLSRSKGPLAALLPRYIDWAETIVRNKGDVVFVTHMLLYMLTIVPSFLWLFYHFTYVHGVAHWLMAGFYCGPFTLMLHNHIHNNGLLVRSGYAGLFDRAWPYVLEPLMGHTWDSYFAHHVKHHHVENNGPGDLSSTIWYQRDNIFHFFLYEMRFLALTWVELPLYFWSKGQRLYAFRVGGTEMLAYAFIFFMAQWNFKAALFTLVLPFVQMRIGLMVGNFGQHAFVDHDEPSSDFRASITLVDVQSNRYCFNDGYHTSHHLNPLRHWRDHPRAFITAKHAYSSQQALVFKDIDFVFITVNLLRKDYAHLAKCLVPIGEQIGMSMEERIDMLKDKTKIFTREEIHEKFGKGK